MEIMNKNGMRIIRKERVDADCKLRYLQMNA